MQDITRADIQAAISGFLNDQFLKKAEPDIKRLEKAEADGNEAAIAAAQDALAQWRQKRWLGNGGCAAAMLRYGAEMCGAASPAYRHTDGGGGCRFATGREFRGGGHKIRGNAA